MKSTKGRSGLELQNWIVDSEVANVLKLDIKYKIVDKCFFINP